MAYTTIDDPTILFNTILYTGNDASNRGITGVNFAPNWVWIKKRNNAAGGVISDTVRGAGKVLYSSETNAEGSESASFVSFDSDGYTISQDAGVGLNVNGHTYVGWNWKAGTSFTNDASATGIGTIDSSGSVNQDAGFSIVSYTATSGTSSIKHGLNTVPSVIILKTRAESASWFVGNASLGWDKVLFLNLTNAASTDDRVFSPSSGSDPTSSIFFSDQAGIASAGNMIAYCFAEKKGYSKFGSYTGNGNADGTFVYCGFRPAFLLWKQTNTGGQTWGIFDNKRDPDNFVSLRLVPNATDSEGSPSAAASCDFLSNGFKWRSSFGSRNGDGGTYFFMAFAESPFVNSNGVPTNAR